MKLLEHGLNGEANYKYLTVFKVNLHNRAIKKKTKERRESEKEL